MSGFLCRKCGAYHDSLPFHYGVAAPVAWDALHPDDRARRAQLSSDQCIIDGQYFFLRGTIDIPVIDEAMIFSWSVWVSVSQQSFARTSELWHTPSREQTPAVFGWLQTSIPGYPETLNLKTMLHTRPVGERPFIELEPTDHPLAQEQRMGITRDRVQAIAEQLLHDE